MKLFPYILFEIYLYFSTGNGQLTEPALRRLYRHFRSLYELTCSALFV